MSANKNAGKHPSYDGYSISSIARKRAYDKKYHKTKERKRYRLNKENRERGTYGNGDGMDVSHSKKGFKLELARINRARNGRNGKSTKS